MKFSMEFELQWKNLSWNGTLIFVSMAAADVLATSLARTSAAIMLPQLDNITWPCSISLIGHVTLEVITGITIPIPYRTIHDTVGNQQISSL